MDCMSLDGSTVACASSGQRLWVRPSAMCIHAPIGAMPLARARRYPNHNINVQRMAPGTTVTVIAIHAYACAPPTYYSDMCDDCSQQRQASLDPTYAYSRGGYASTTRP